jgi:predicted transcriptional regulator
MKIEKLTEAEEVVMRAIWDIGKEPVLSEVMEQVTGFYEKDWRPQTVSTFLAKLVRKKYLRLQRNGKIYTYKILISAEDYNREQLKSLYIFLYQNNKEAIKQDVAEL